jgi:hypothetical protein
MKIEIFLQIFEKFSNINFMKIFPVGTELFHAERDSNGRTDGYDEANSRMSQSC